MKKITGLSIRTNNRNSQDILKLWNDFYTLGHFQKLWLEWKEIYGVYSNYSSDENWDFDLLIGWESDIQDGYSTITLEDTLYKEYTTSGEMPQKVVDTWWKIWSDTIPRAYKTDYELYTPGENPENPHTTIFIGIL